MLLYTRRWIFSRVEQTVYSTSNDRKPAGTSSTNIYVLIAPSHFSQKKFKKLKKKNEMIDIHFEFWWHNNQVGQWKSSRYFLFFLRARVSNLKMKAQKIRFSF